MECTGTGSVRTDTETSSGGYGGGGGGVGIHFSKEQLDVFSKYKQGENIFITGPGGTGKSAIIREIYRHAKENGREIQVCALTGCAAVLLQCNAKTIHSWAGIGQGTGSIESIVEKVASSRHRKKNWNQTEILVVDEVSMMSLKLFELLDAVGKKVRKAAWKPFGGIQVIFSGDFYQLPPVGDADEIETSQFCFESAFWNVVFKRENQIPLVQIFRQSDPVYAAILNQLREGKLKRSSYEILMGRVGKSVVDDGIVDIQPTKLFPRRHKVEQVNQLEMAKLCGEEKVYKMKRLYDASGGGGGGSGGGVGGGAKKVVISNEDKEYEFTYLEKSVSAEMQVRLKVGAQVMCIVNMETSSGVRLCNGSQGIILRFNSVGMPVVKYHGIEQEVTMEYHTWASESCPGMGVSQMPLILAWALTIHKAQGTTLELAEIDVGNDVFECGQTYVALSRVKSLSGLYLSSFNYTKILTSKKVKEYYRGAGGSEAASAPLTPHQG
jgi:ATP-dependent DNA helicase PIF1